MIDMYSDIDNDSDVNNNLISIFNNNNLSDSSNYQSMNEENNSFDDHPKVDINNCK
jgi:hypothetical protein